MKQNIVLLLVLITSILGYGYLGYFTNQSNATANFIAYALCFVGYFILVKSDCSWKKLVICTLLVHLLFLVAIPSLSPDVYRFLWDGELVVQGIHSFAHTPNEIVNNNLMEMTTYRTQLYNQITELSKGNYSVYPTLNQIYFIIPAWLSDQLLGSIVIMRLLLLLSTGLGCIFIVKMLDYLNLPRKRLFLFVMNPLLVVEGTGNLHFEGVMFVLLIGAIYMFLTNRTWNTSLLLSMAVNIKLTPLLILPFFAFLKNWKKSLVLIGGTILFSGAFLVLLIWPSILAHFWQSIDLYFTNFEFNSSFYRLLFSALEPLYTYDTVKYVGPLLALLTFGIISGIAIKNAGTQNMLVNALFAYTIFMLFSATVHPWYVIVPLGISIFTNFRYMIAWSGLVFLSYFLYGTNTNGQVWIILLEYTLVCFVFVLDMLDRRKNPSTLLK